VFSIPRQCGASCAIKTKNKASWIPGGSLISQRPSSPPAGGAGA